MRDRLWTKDFTIDVCINFLLYVIMYQLMLWSTQFAIHTWDATVSEAGLASGIFIIGALSSRIVTGHVIDALGRKKALLVGTGIYMAGLLLYFPVHSLTAFLVIRCLHGAAYGISATAASTIVGAIVPPKRRGEGIGYYALGNTLASAAGPFLGMTLCSGGNYYLNVYVCIGLAVLTFALAAAIHSPEHVCTAADRAALKSLRWDSFISVQALPISIITEIQSQLNMSDRRLDGQTDEQTGGVGVGLNLAIAGSIFFCTYSVTSFFSRPIIGRFLDHHGGDAVMYPTLVILALCMAAVGLAESNALFAIGGVLLGLSYSTVTSSGQALAIHGVPEGHIGLATSTFFIFVDLGVGVGPYMLGSLVPAYGFSSVYFGAAVIALAAIPLYYALIGRTGVFSYKQMERIRSKER